LNNVFPLPCNYKGKFPVTDGKFPIIRDIFVGVIEKMASLALSTSQGFFFGGVAGMMATCVVQPIDLIKVRHQSGSE